MEKSGTGAVQMTGRAKWVLHHFGFLKGNIVQKASPHTAGFSTSTASVTISPDESRGSGTGRVMESMDTSAQALCQPGFSSATTSTPHQSQAVLDWLKKAREGEDSKGVIHTSHNSLNPFVYLLVLMLKYILFLVPYLLI